MSTYTSYPLQGIRSREVLLAAIATLGLQAEVLDKPTTLAGYFHRDRAKGASIVIRRSEFAKVGTYSYLDIGFAENPDKSWTIQTDGHLPTKVKDPKGTEQMVNFEDAIQTAYKQVNGDRAVKTILTKTIPRLKALGKIPSHATVKKTVVAGTTRVLVSY